MAKKSESSKMDKEKKESPLKASIQIEKKEPATPVTLKEGEKKPEEKKELTEAEKKAKEEEEKEKQHRLESFRKAGDIYKKAIEYIKPKIVIGAKLDVICEDAENKIKELGGEVGFPVNISINDIAAHYSAVKDDDKTIMEGDIVKVDLGVAVDGYLVDGAFTVSFNKEDRTKNMILAVETAVLKGLSMIKPGVKTNEIGAATYNVIKGFGYNVIKELSGHSIEQWEVHGSKEIPSVPMPSGVAFEEGEAFALECFATTGSGKIHVTQLCTIFSLDPRSERVPLRSKISRQIYNWVAEHKKTLPFSQREIVKEFKTAQFGLRELQLAGKLIEHKVLREEKGTYVAQSEHSFLVTKDGIERLT
jgi:methionyl aminopeptidase